MKKYKLKKEIMPDSVCGIGHAHGVPVLRLLLMLTEKDKASTAVTLHSEHAV